MTGVEHLWNLPLVTVRPPMAKFTAHASIVEITSATPQITFFPTPKGVGGWLRDTVCGIWTVRPRAGLLFVVGVLVIPVSQIRLPVALNRMNS
jgi:hypothetical protein